MTSKLTRERIELIANFHRAMTLPPSHAEIEELARMALAAMDSEPVIIVGDDGGDALSYRRLIQSFEPGTKLYLHAQPAPVVNGEYGDAYQGAREDLAIWKRRALEAEESVRRLEQINDHLVKEAQGESRMGEPVIAQPAPVVPDAATAIRACLSEFPESARDIVEECADIAENACLAAMLAAAPHDTPALNSVQNVVTVPGKWIPVSEQMPEDRTQVILWDAEIGEVTSGHYSHKTQTFYHCGDAIENEITHWMPPPCAPQEVK
ncbi:DUF551 domain-containing protein [Klebsiella pneumoniae]|nr:DUF551 domain-containing protein [Klebsiella pneumoniae]HBS9998596.1 DUF551 domain-containing protein [Klebsiella pneumoniae]